MNGIISRQKNFLCSGTIVISQMITYIIHIYLDGSQLWLSAKSLGFGVPII